MSQRTDQIRIISYEGSSYKTDFWEGQGREYENITERKALRRLLPEAGETIIEVGAGFGRLADLYHNYEQIILIDYSLSLLAQARKKFSGNPKYQFIAANVYSLPLANDVADTVVMIRVAHHLESIDVALSEIHRVLQGGKTFILEFANKRNTKSIARFLLKKQGWSPFDPAPYEFAPLNYDFHPDWMQRTIENAGFRTDKELAISNFRVEAIKKRIPPTTLATIDNAIAGPGSIFKLSPSILTKNTSTKRPAKATDFFQCPKCGEKDMKRLTNAIACQHCGTNWPIIDGVIDFRFPRPKEV